MNARITSLTERTRRAGEGVLAEEKSGVLAHLPFLGPAVIASIAYMDPGNFATNIQSGAQYGYMLLWVVLVANLIAMLFQALSAKLGIVTGKSLAEHCREQLPAWATYALWIGSELAAMATDLAEVLGGAIGLTLLFGLPLIVSAAITGVATYVILLLEGTGFRPMEIVIGTFVGAISLSYIAELFIAPPAWGSALFHAVVPQLAGGDSVLLAVGIVGATVMPHAIYLHSSLTKDRIPVRGDADVKRVLTFSNHEVLLALGAAGLVNMAMVAMSAVVFFATGHQNVASIESAYHTLTPLLGIAAAGIFMLSLLASGFSSSVVGTMAGQTIMQDFVHFKVPLSIRRLLTLVPTFFVIGFGVDPTQALIVSQVVLSLLLPLPIIALIVFTSRKDIMGQFASGPLLLGGASLASLVVIALNVLLLLQVVRVPIPLLSA